MYLLASTQNTDKTRYKQCENLNLNYFQKLNNVTASQHRKRYFFFLLLVFDKVCEMNELFYFKIH